MPSHQGTQLTDVLLSQICPHPRQPEPILQRVSAMELSRDPSAPPWAWVGNSELGMEQHWGWSVPAKNSCVCSPFTDWGFSPSSSLGLKARSVGPGVPSVGTVRIWVFSSPEMQVTDEEGAREREWERHFQHGGSISIRQIKCHKSPQWCWRSVAPVPHASALWPSEVRGTHSNLASVRSLVNLILFSFS